MKILNYIILGLLLCALGYIGWGLLNPKIKEVYIQVKPKPQIIYKQGKDSTIIAKTTIIRESKPVNVDSLKEKWGSILPESQKRTQQIAELTEIKARLEGELKAKDIVINDLSGKTQQLAGKTEQLKSEITTWKGKYMEIAYNKDSGSVKYSYNAEIKMAGVKKDKFGNTMEMSLTSPDKNFKINGVDIYRQEVKFPVRKIGVGIQGGYYYLPALNRIEPGIGIGISYNFIRL